MKTDKKPFDTYKTCKDCPYRYYGCHDRCEGKKERNRKQEAIRKARREEMSKYSIKWTRQV